MNVKTFLTEVVSCYYQKDAPWIKYILQDEIAQKTETELISAWYQKNMPSRLAALTEENEWAHWITLLCLRFWDEEIGGLPPYQWNIDNAPEVMKND